MTSLTIAACGVGENGAQDGGGDEGGGTFIYAINANPSHLNPAITTSTVTTHPGCLVYEGLVTLNKDLDVESELAESWEVSDDGKTYTFQLATSASWHDGEPFTSADVVWTLNNITRTYGSRAAAAFERIDDVRAPDDQTVIIELSEPYGPLLVSLTCLNAAILPKHLYEGTDVVSNEYNTNPIGTGPFKFDSWESGERITLVRNEDWRVDERPKLSRVVMRILPDAEAATLAIEAGEIDAIGADSMTPTGVMRADEMAGVETYYDDMFPSVDLLMFNTRREPLDDPTVRQAIARGIDRNAIVEKAFAGLADPGQNAIGPLMENYNNPTVNYMEMYPFDPERSKQILQESGAADPQLELSLAYEQAKPGFESAAQIIRSNLESAGISVSLKPLERTVMLEEVFENHSFDLYYTSYAQGPHPEIGVTRAYKCDSIGTDSFNNVAGYCNEEVDQLFDDGVAGSDEEAKEAYSQAAAIIAEDLPALVIMQDRAQGLKRTAVKDLGLGAQPSMYWDHVWIDE